MKLYVNDRDEREREREKGKGEGEEGERERESKMEGLTPCPFFFTPSFTTTVQSLGRCPILLHFQQT